MKVTDHLAAAENTLFSFEILPPLKGKSIASIYDGIDPLMEFKPKFINVTYHREEFVYIEREHGLLEKKAVRKRPGTVGICAAIMHKYDVDAIPHLICGGFSKEETENALIDLHFLGIDNVLALRGDAVKSEASFRPHPEGHAYAVELIEQVHQMNTGEYFTEGQGQDPTHFCIGAAAYPEKHFEAMNLETDLHYLKAKVDAGATYLVTQMFFDNQKYFDFVNLCRENGITIPIIPGLKPISTTKQLTLLPQRFNLNVPNPLVDAVIKCKNNEDIRQVGVEWAIQQTKELIEFGAPCIHFYTMGKSDNVVEIVANFA